MRLTTRFQNKASRWATLAALWLLALATIPATAGTEPSTGPGRAAPTPSLAQALNPDGTLRPGASGSFDARQFVLRTAPGGRPVFRPAAPAGAGDEYWRGGLGLPNCTNGGVTAVVQSGANLYIGGSFTVVGNVRANNIARWDGSNWNALGSGAINGVNGEVRSLAVAGNGDLYVGGNFGLASGTVANYIARWDGTAWAPLGTGVAGIVHAVAVASNGDVYAGGQFQPSSAAPAGFVARWNGARWNTLGAAGMTYSLFNRAAVVYAVAVSSNGDVYAGGQFELASGALANSVARWTGASWQPLGGGVSGEVRSLAVAGNGDLYVGGAFGQGVGTAAANYIARWNGTAWAPLGTGVSHATGLPVVYSVAVAGNGDVYAGGYFTQAGGVAANGAAKWNGTTWSPVGVGLSNEVDNYVVALAVSSNGDVYTGMTGTRSIASGRRGYVARWNGTAWNAVGAGRENGVDGPINAVVVAGNGAVYVGGDFRQAGAAAANNVARWDGTAWSTLGAGATNGVDGTVYALAVAGNGDLYVGGNFRQAGGATAYSIARWNGTAWNALSTGTSFASAVDAVAVAPNGDVYVGGIFTQAGGTPAANVAKWNGTAWSALGTGVNNDVRALAVAGNGDVYVGGEFRQAGGTAANYIARWDGTAWSTLGAGTTSGVNGRVYALAVAGNGDLYVGGEFGQAGGTPASAIARWDGTAWASFGTGVGSTGAAVYSVAVAGNGDVYAGGYFAQAGAVPAARVAKWSGGAWSALGTGLNNNVQALALSGSALYAGGMFTGVGDSSKVSANFGVYDPLAPLAAATPTRTATLGLHPNPARGTAVLTVPAASQARRAQIFDATGREVSSQLLPARATTAALSLRGLAPGLYVVRCGMATGRLVVE